MPEQPDPTLPPPVALRERMRANPGLAPLVAEAEATWRSRAAAHGGGPDEGAPAWRAFEDAFPTFYEFTNRPRLGGRVSPRRADSQARPTA